MSYKSDQNQQTRVYVITVNPCLISEDTTIQLHNIQKYPFLIALLSEDQSL